MRNLNKMNDRELKAGTAGVSGKSWHDSYKGSAWIFVGGLEYTLTEGDIICVFSQLVPLAVCFLIWCSNLIDWVASFLQILLIRVTV